MEGMCLDCAFPAADDSVRCATHRDKHREASRESWRRRNGKKARRPKRRSQPRAPGAIRAAILELRTMTRLTTRELPPIVSEAEHPTMRVVRALRWLEWPTMQEIIHAAAGITNAADPVGWNNWTNAVLRVMRKGWAERRGHAGAFEYNLTSSGLARVAELRRAA